MYKHPLIEAALIVASKEGLALNGQDKFVMRTSLSNVLAAKERHRQRMGTSEFQWKKPAPPKR